MKYAVPGYFSFDSVSEGGAMTNCWNTAYPKKVKFVYSRQSMYLLFSRMSLVY